jgi:probable O-glycosylation ligase (exosortase A-associated)
VLAYETSQDWWRPSAGAAPVSEPVPDTDVAFKSLVAFTIILLLAPQEWFPILKSLRIAFIAAILACVAHMFDNTVQRRPVSTFVPEMGIALVLVAWSIITIPLSYWPGGSVNVLTDHFLKAIAFFWLIGTLVITRKRLSVFAWALTICSIPIAATGLMHYQSGAFVTSHRAAVQRIAGYMGGSGLAGNPNDLALILNLLIPVTGALMLLTRNAFLKALAALTILLSIATVVITFSRAGFIALATIVVLSFIALVKRRSPGAAIAIFVAALAAPPMLPPGYLNRLSTITDVDADPTGSAQGRLSDFNVALDVVARNPVTGVGLGQDILALNQERGPRWRSVHNVYLEYAVDLGLPGLALFVALLIASFRTAQQVRSRVAREPALGDLAVLAGGVEISLIAFAVEAFFHPIAYQFYFFCVGGLAVALKNTCRTELEIARSAADPDPAASL